MTTNEHADFASGPVCPVPISRYPTVLLAHGGGGKLTQHLIQSMFQPLFSNPALDALHDGATLTIEGARLAFTTDAHVVSPIVFPGGDIGMLAVNGTVNDLAMCGAQPLYLSAALIIEEGLPMERLWEIVRSMSVAAAAAGVQIVTGDTKVVEKGKGDGIFITTTGVGVIQPGISMRPDALTPGDRVLLSGRIAEHGIAILSVREGLEFGTTIRSDTAPLHRLAQGVLRAAPSVRVMRDPTRGGIASALNELAHSSDVGIALREECIPVAAEVHGACELLGLDPLYVANEGKLLAIVPPEDAAKALASMRADPLGRDAADIGEVTSAHPGTVTMQTAIGGERVVDMLSGEQLPRIC
ncbi:MAG: hydrogenase expression/formation protein HypE [Bacteroidetes bacterium]|nr:hydrogenase expression/formation protein HypE [Bacteroidota bacterium]